MTRFADFLQLENKNVSVKLKNCKISDEEYLEKIDKGKNIIYSVLLAVLPRNRLDSTLPSKIVVVVANSVQCSYLLLLISDYSRSPRIP